jgi:hypothetical protein
LCAPAPDKVLMASFQLLLLIIGMAFPASASGVSKSDLDGETVAAADPSPFGEIR